MVTKTPNHSDLQNLKNEIKLEIGEEQRKIRHESNGKIQEDYYKIDSKINEYRSDLKVTNQSMERMQKDIDDIKKMLSEFIKTVPTIYATKEDHERNEKRIIDLEKDRKNILVETAKWFIFALLGVGVSFLMYKLGLK